MKRFVMLTQDNCPNCERLKLMLDKPLKGQFNEQLETVHRREQTERFEELAQQYQVMATPVLIDLQAERVLTNTSGLGEVKAFLSV